MGVISCIKERLAPRRIKKITIRLSPNSLGVPHFPQTPDSPLPGTGSHGTFNNTKNNTNDNIERRTMMRSIAANELKVKGVSSIEAALKDEEEAVISVRGKERYVVMDIETYNRLRVCELEAALYEARREIAEGKGIEETVEEHLDRLKQLEP